MWKVRRCLSKDQVQVGKGREVGGVGLKWLRKVCQRCQPTREKAGVNEWILWLALSSH